MTNYNYEDKYGAWVVWDGNEGTARELKSKTGEPVLIYDPEKERFYEFKMEYESKPLHVKNGKFTGRAKKSEY